MTKTELTDRVHGLKKKEKRIWYIKMEKKNLTNYNQNIQSTRHATYNNNNTRQVNRMYVQSRVFLLFFLLLLFYVFIMPWYIHILGVCILLKQQRKKRKKKSRKNNTLYALKYMNFRDIFFSTIYFYSIVRHTLSLYNILLIF